MEWIRGDPIGHGSFATVNLAIPTCHNPQFSQLMAVKSCGASHSASLLNEKFILNELRNCPQIINCSGDSFSFEQGEKLYNLILEYASGGALSDKLKNMGSRQLPESDVRRYTNSILRGLQCIHENGYVHCDIKLQNVLLFEIGGQDSVKIADFGLAKEAGAKEGDSRSELRGTPLYMSPEMVAGGEQESPADIWALGCAVAEMVTGDLAWRCSDMCGLLMKIGVGQEVPEIPGKLSEEGKDFLGKCFVKDPKKRWTAEMLLNHPFVADHDDDCFSTVPLKDIIEFPSTSPRSAFDFPDCATAQSSMTCSITLLPSPAARLEELVIDRRPDWCCSDDWISVR